MEMTFHLNQAGAALADIPPCDTVHPSGMPEGIGGKVDSILLLIAVVCAAGVCPCRHASGMTGGPGERLIRGGHDLQAG